MSETNRQRYHRTSKACESCRKKRKKCSPPFPCKECTTANRECTVRSKPRHRGQAHHVSQQYERVGLDRASKPPIPEGDGRLGTRDMSNPVSNQVIARTGTSIEVVQAIQDAFALTAVSALKLDSHFQFPKLSEPLPRAEIDRYPQSGDLSNDTWQQTLSLEDASAVLENLCFNYGLEALFLDYDDLKRILRDFGHHCGTYLPLEFGLLPQGEALQCDALGMLFAALSLGTLREPPASARRNYSQRLFEASKSLVGMHVGKASLHIAAALVMQHLFAVATGSTNQAKSIITQAVQTCHELNLHQFDEECTTEKGTWLYLLVYMADMYGLTLSCRSPLTEDRYSSTTHSTLPLITSGDFDREVFEYLSRADSSSEPIIRLVIFNGHLFERIHRDKLDVEEVRRLQSTSQLAALPLMTWKKTVAKDLGNKQSLIKYHMFNLARIHMLWSRITLMSGALSHDTHLLLSLTICLRGAQMILASYTEMHALQLFTTPNLLTWRQFERVTCSTYLILIAYWQQELLEDETVKDLNRGIALLKLLEKRWSIAGEVKNLVLHLARASELELSDDSDENEMSEAALIEPTNLADGNIDVDFYQPFDQDFFAIPGPLIEGWLDFGSTTGMSREQWS